MYCRKLLRRGTADEFSDEKFGRWSAATAVTFWALQRRARCFVDEFTAREVVCTSEFLVLGRCFGSFGLSQIDERRMKRNHFNDQNSHLPSTSPASTCLPHESLYLARFLRPCEFPLQKHVPRYCVDEEVPGRFEPEPVILRDHLLLQRWCECVRCRAVLLQRHVHAPEYPW